MAKVLELVGIVIAAALLFGVSFAVFLFGCAVFGACAL